MVAVLILGGSGYLGQFLVQHLAAAGHSVAYTYATHELPPGSLGAGAFGVQADMVTGKGLAEALSVLGQPLQLVVNTVAISQPAACERDHAAAQAVNIPSKLLEALVRARDASGHEPTLVHLSTDQVYDGTQPMSHEDTPVAPVNAYGRSKAEAEAAVATAWPKHVILRSSLIYGPAPPVPVGRPLFLQFVHDRLREGTPTSFFEDEMRCPVFVHDIYRVVQRLAAAQHPQQLPNTLYNMGGPQRLSRVDIARTVAQHCSLNESAIVAVPSASVERGYSSPLDISMDSTRLEKDLQLQLTPLGEALQRILPAGAINAHSTAH